MTEGRQRVPRASNLQKTELIKYFEDNPSSLRAINSTPDTKLRQRIWIELAHKLNSLDGALKTSSKWSKYWNDIIIYTKSRAKSAIKYDTRCDRAPKDLELRLLNVIGELTLANAWQERWNSKNWSIPNNEDGCMNDDDDEAAEWVDVENYKKILQDNEINDGDTSMCDDSINEQEYSRNNSHTQDNKGRINIESIAPVSIKNVSVIEPPNSSNNTANVTTAASYVQNFQYIDFQPSISHVHTLKHSKLETRLNNKVQIHNPIECVEESITKIEEQPINRNDNEILISSTQLSSEQVPPPAVHDLNNSHAYNEEKPHSPGSRQSSDIIASELAKSVKTMAQGFTVIAGALSDIAKILEKLN